MPQPQLSNPQVQVDDEDQPELPPVGSPLYSPLQAQAQPKPILPPPPASAPPVSDHDYKSLMVTPEDMQNAADAKRAIAMAGAVGNTMANRQSFGNFFLGRMNPHNDVAGSLRPLAETADQDIRNKQMLQKQTLEAPELKYNQDMQDASSTQSKLTKSIALGAISALKANPAFKDSPDAAKHFDEWAKQINDPSTTGMDIHMIMEKNSMLKEAFTASLAGQKMDALWAGIGIKKHNSDRADAQFGQTTEKTGAAQGKDITNNPVMANLQQRRNQILIDKHTIESGALINSSVASELATGLANAFGGGKGAGLKSSEKQELQSLSGDLKKADSYLTGTPQEQWSPEQRQFVAQTLGRAYDAFGKAQYSTAKQLAVPKQGFTSPVIKKSIDDTVESFNPEHQSIDQPNPEPTTSAEDSAALQWAKANQGSPKAAQILLHLSRKQGGQ